MKISKDKPFYPISMAAEILGISPDRLRGYEEEGLIKPYRVKKVSEKQRGEKRLFSQDDIEWVGLLRELIQNGVSIPALKVIIQLLPYWEKSQKPEIKKLVNDENWVIIKKLVKSPIYQKLIENK